MVVVVCSGRELKRLPVVRGGRGRIAFSAVDRAEDVQDGGLGAQVGGVVRDGERGVGVLAGLA